MLSLHEVEQQLNFWGWGANGSWETTLFGAHLTFNPKTLIMTWITMGLVILFGLAATRGMSMRKPKGAQNILEAIWEFIRGLVNDNMDPKKGAALLSIVVTYFIFILFANLIGLVPTLGSPTADYNTTLGLALCTFVIIYIFGLRYKGLG